MTLFWFKPALVLSGRGNPDTLWNKRLDEVEKTLPNCIFSILEQFLTSEISFINGLLYATKNFIT